MTSNVGQNYPYTSETEVERAARVEAILNARRLDALEQHSTKSRPASE